MREYAVDQLARRLFADTGMPFSWSALTHDQQDGFYDRAHFYIALVDDCRKAQLTTGESVNPYLPPPPEDGHHNFENGSYRCLYCAVYNRPDVPSTKTVLDQPCKGRYAESGKMRAWAEDKWTEERENA